MVLRRKKIAKLANKKGGIIIFMEDSSINEELRYMAKVELSDIE